ncbi:MAG TPA: MarR family transcriptional regulator [Acetobacteraceae bacterium]|nr:MarR family transcriptional regulator [Acetobacteraceae bacterium]
MAKREIAPLSPCNNAALRQATRRLGQLYDDIMAPSGLRATQHGMLYQIDTLNNATLRELAASLAMDLSALGHTLKPLQEAGLVALTPDEADRRAKRVTLTEAGQEKLAQTTQLWRTAQTRFESAFGKQRAVELRAVMSHLASDDFVRRFAAA